MIYDTCSKPVDLLAPPPRREVGAVDVLLIYLNLISVIKTSHTNYTHIYSIFYIWIIIILGITHTIVGPPPMRSPLNCWILWDENLIFQFPKPLCTNMILPTPENVSRDVYTTIAGYIDVYTTIYTLMYILPNIHCWRVYYNIYIDTKMQQTI